MNLRAVIQYLAALSLLGIVAVLALDQIIMPLYVRHGQVSYMPNVVGLSYTEAAEILKKSGFRAEKTHVAHTQEYLPNRVFETYPAAYARVKKGRIIQLTVTAAEKMVPVPDVVAKSLRTAEIEIARAGLIVDTILTAYSDDFKAGNVTWQSPRGGNLLRRGSGMSLMVSSGEPPQSFYVPGIIGMAYQAGRRQILDAGLELGRVKYIYAPNLLPNTIIDQSIAGGTVLKVRRSINLTVSTYEEINQ